jgi:RsiW-degrading membrane proteinase PrsW (M82 family)
LAQTRFEDQKTVVRSYAGPRGPARVRTKHRRIFLFVIAVFIIGAIALAAGDPAVDTLFVLAVAPGAYLMWHFHHADKYKTESTKLLLGSFALGAALSIVAGLVETLYFGVLQSADLITTFFIFLFGVGLVEEGVKFISVRVYAYRSVHFDEPMDGIIFGISAALGFASLENVGYVFQYGAATAFTRALISVPGHAFWGAILGYYLGEAKVQRRPLLAVQGLAIAVFLHGTFDTLATVIPDQIVGLLVLFGLVWVSYFEIVKKEIARAQLESPYVPGRIG